MTTIINLAIEGMDHSKFDPVQIKQVALKTSNQIKSTLKHMRDKQHAQERKKKIHEDETVNESREPERINNETIDNLESDMEMEEEDIEMTMDENNNVKKLSNKTQ